MKKLLLIVLTILTIFISSCTIPRPEVDSTYWGSSYGKMEIIDGFKVCLRADGYYQIVGITKKAIHNNVLIIPQYINNIPVMGLGAPVVCDYNTHMPLPQMYTPLYDYLYNQKQSIMLEDKSTRRNCYLDARGFSLYEGISDVKQVYINCHHVNFNLLELFSSDTIIVCNLQSIFTEKSLDYYTKLLDEDQSNLLLFFTTKIGSIESNVYYNYNYSGSNSDYTSTRKLIFDSATENIRHELYNQALNLYVEKQCNISIRAYLSWLDRNGLEDTEDSFKQYKEVIKESYEGTSYQSNDYYNYETKVSADLYPYYLGSSNIEFYYNLSIGGKEYHSFTRPNDSLYWIDRIENGEKVMEPPIPYVEGQTFLGWYIDSECTTLYDFNQTVQNNDEQLVWLKLYAKWK